MWLVVPHVAFVVVGSWMVASWTLNRHGAEVVPHTVGGDCNDDDDDIVRTGSRQRNTLRWLGRLGPNGSAMSRDCPAMPLGIGESFWQACGRRSPS